jgi:uncharacterized repeat protein (TIGR01451 family)
MRVTQVWRNDVAQGGDFSLQPTTITGVDRGDAAWGDYDNDGDLDILLTGWTSSTHVTQVWRNDGMGAFSLQSSAPTGVEYGSAVWGDYDNDGDLDILLAGNSASSRVTEVWRNDDCADVLINKAVTPTQAAPGQAITYTLGFSNASDVIATNVLITDVLPLSLTVQNIVSNGLAITDTGAVPAYVWEVEDLGPGEWGLITITGVLSGPLAAGTSFTNTAKITTTGDADPGNNISDATLTVLSQSPTCTQVTDVVLTQATTGTVYVGDTAQFSADLAPDDAAKPYTYTVYLDGTTLVYPQAGNTDPLTFSHTFPTTGTYTVEVAVWNCGLGEAEAVTDTVKVEMVEHGEHWVYLPVILRRGP